MLRKLSDFLYIAGCVIWNNLLVIILIVVLFGGTGYGLFMLAKSANSQNVVDPRVSSYTLKAEITGVTTDETGKVVFRYRVIEADSLTLNYRD
ncbi:MAG: hypothetical protein UW68_C0022G0006 [Candidatus Collierbacteria bacterium GW2011_GWB1_44_6]|uniref:Uncharacterized protein n=2 Tax=Candidatus Collieribacteriota TaxID=1752725 RepID=A0A0G1JNC3_9BACT|nr:MAG: hypothetical protein UV68_C0011G0014 [Candidatus Collierbacteria bacterium GW2011_GWC2_43_12]KKT72868.1 MAG: hypothetical protein UW68_C0022G0006 [Candidatus Collierbacteria bacterium GW2011_GWB1_44_6]KKT82332.1 MAG: hypothetical protein UW80_C0039G0010 [Microgenomates group bacterium GW2011_GWC1_44_9]